MLLGQRVRLAPLEKGHLATFIQWFNDPEVTQYLLNFTPLTMENEEEWYAKTIHDPNVVVLAIIAIDLTPPVLIGNLAIRCHWKDRRGVVGISLGEKAYWGKGYGTEAMRILLQYGFDTLNLHRIELEVDADNSRAIHVYKKLGFREEGCRRQAIFKRGKYDDIIGMSILLEEYQQHKSSSPP